jgi:hypothetical protein
VVVGWVFGERDLEVDLDAPTGHADFLDDESQQSPATFDVEVIERGGDTFSAVGEPASQPVLGGELRAATGKRVLLQDELTAAGGDGGAAPGEIVEFEQSSLVGVEQSGSFSLAAPQGRCRGGRAGQRRAGPRRQAPAITARSAAISCLGFSSAWRTCWKTHSSSSLARMLRSGQAALGWSAHGQITPPSTPPGGGFTEAVKRRAAQPRARVPVVDDVLDHLMPVGLGRRAQRLKLRADRPAFLLTLGRHPRVERNPHSPPPSESESRWASGVATATRGSDARVASRACPRSSGSSDELDQARPPPRRRCLYPLEVTDDCRILVARSKAATGKLAGTYGQLVLQRSRTTARRK